MMLYLLAEKASEKHNQPQENKKLEEELENTKKTYSLMAAAKKETEEAY